jgi:hypothetical protein
MRIEFLLTVSEDLGQVLSIVKRCCQMFGPTPCVTQS